MGQREVDHATGSRWGAGGQDVVIGEVAVDDDLLAGQHSGVVQVAVELVGELAEDRCAVGGDAGGCKLW
jgi:hypothetical protein